MIVVDTSAAIAILGAEPDAARYAASLEDNDVIISTGTVVELLIVALARWGRDGALRAEALLEEAQAVLHPVGVAETRIAAEAYRRFGRNSGSPARLNFGDCFAYALARHLDLPLLFKGEDFVHTDIRAVPDLP